MRHLTACLLLLAATSAMAGHAEFPGAPMNTIPSGVYGGMNFQFNSDRDVVIFGPARVNFHVLLLGSAPGQQVNVRRCTPSCETNPSSAIGVDPTTPVSLVVGAVSAVRLDSASPFTLEMVADHLYRGATKGAPGQFINMTWQLPSGGNMIGWQMNQTFVERFTTYPASAEWLGIASGIFSSSVSREQMLFREEGTNQLIVQTVDPPWATALGPIPSSAEVIAVRDFTGDDRADILVRDHLAMNLALWTMPEMNGQPVTPAITFLAQQPSSNWSVVAAGDINRDGRCDLVWRHSATGEVVVWFMNGAQLLGHASVAIVPLQWICGGSDDFDVDVYDDLIWHNTETGQVVNWLMQGTSIRETRTLAVLPSPADWRVEAIFDYESFWQGRPNIIWRNLSDGHVAQWSFTGNGGPVSGAIVATMPPEWISTSPR